MCRTPKKTCHHGSDTQHIMWTFCVICLRLLWYEPFARLLSALLRRDKYKMCHFPHKGGFYLMPHYDFHSFLSTPGIIPAAICESRKRRRWSFMWFLRHCHPKVLFTYIQCQPGQVLKKLVAVMEPRCCHLTVGFLKLQSKNMHIYVDWRA